MKIKKYNYNKCYCCFQSFKKIRKNYDEDLYYNFLRDTKLNDDIISHIIDYIIPDIYTIIMSFYNGTINRYYCKKCFSIGLYQFNKKKQYLNFYQNKFFSLRKQRGNLFDYDDMNEIKYFISSYWKDDRRFDVIPFSIPYSIQSLKYFSSYFVGNLNSEWYVERKDEREFALKWIKNKDVPSKLTLYYI